MTFFHKLKATNRPKLLTTGPQMYGSPFLQNAVQYIARVCGTAVPDQSFPQELKDGKTSYEYIWSAGLQIQ
jgi:hypothetical protein